MLKKISLWIVLSIALLLTIFDFEAQAYIDPGSGSVLLQLLLGGVAGVAVVAKLYWERIKDRCRSLFGPTGKNDQ